MINRWLISTCMSSLWLRTKEMINRWLIYLHVISLVALDLPACHLFGCAPLQVRKAALLTLGSLEPAVKTTRRSPRVDLVFIWPLCLSYGLFDRSFSCLIDQSDGTHRAIVVLLGGLAAAPAGGAGRALVRRRRGVDTRTLL